MNPEIDAPTDLSLFVILNFKVLDLFERILFLDFAKISLLSCPLSQGLFLFELQKYGSRDFLLEAKIGLKSKSPYLSGISLIISKSSVYPIIS